MEKSDQNVKSSDLSAKVLVLLVEDEPVIRTVAAIHLEEAGFETVEAANADEAIILLESDLAIRIVFTDVDMPGSMNGLKLAASIKGRWPPIKIVITTGGFAMHENDMPADSVFIAKPYNCAQIVDAMHKLVH